VVEVGPSVSTDSDTHVETGFTLLHASCRARMLFDVVLATREVNIACS
jgi:hypothetical protein